MAGWAQPAAIAVVSHPSNLTPLLHTSPGLYHPWFQHSLTSKLIQTRSGNAGRIRGGQTQEMQLGASSPLDRVASSNYTTRIAEGLQGPLGARAHLEKDLSLLR